MSMDVIKARKGGKIVFKNPDNGTKEDIAKANLWLDVGGIYTIETVDVNDWVTLVALKGLPNTWFNSVMFDDAPEKPVNGLGFVMMLSIRKYVAVDKTGYPYVTAHPMQAKVWETTEDAIKYRDMFKAKDKWLLKEFFGLILGNEL